MPIEFGVLILNRNGQRWLPGLFATLNADQCCNKSIYLVDNASFDNSLEIAKEQPKVRLLSFKENLGYSRAYNIAADKAIEAGCDWLVLLNSDTLVQPNWLKSIAECIYRHPSAGVVGPRLHDWNNMMHPFMKARYSTKAIANLEVFDDISCDWIQGSCMCISKSCWKRVGGLDEDLFFYWEDADFCRKARYFGYEVYIAPKAIVKHYGGGSSNNDELSKRSLNRRLIFNHYAYKAMDPYTPSVLASIGQILRLYISCISAALKQNSSPAIFAVHTSIAIAFLMRFQFWRAKGNKIILAKLIQEQTPNREL
jgi:GT2 family glycosyltransferase